VQESGANTALKLAKAAIQANLQQARSDYQAALTDAENAHHVLDLLGHPAADGTLRILAPISGVITDRQVSAGQIVDQSQMTPWQMFVLCNTQTVWVDADVYEKDIASISVGEAVRIRVGALPNREFSGTVRRIAPTLDKTSRAVKVRAEIANRNGLLKDGMYADVTIVLGGGRQVLTVPDSTVQHNGDSDYVYVPQNGKYARRQIELGSHQNGRYVIVKGLQEGETVVTHGSIFLDNQISGE
jgi:RND family efflux transporter MFP subunit